MTTTAIAAATARSTFNTNIAKREEIERESETTTQQFQYTSQFAKKKYSQEERESLKTDEQEKR